MVNGLCNLCNFCYLVSGTPSRFFTTSRGIRHGCPLSPLLFILLIEGLSLLIRDAKAKGKGHCGGMDGICCHSGFLFNELDQGNLHSIQHFMPYKADPIQLGFKYLGFFIKPLGYKAEDWYWLVKNFERRIQL